jgi:hypothetical protein
MDDTFILVETMDDVDRTKKDEWFVDMHGRDDQS